MKSSEFISKLKLALKLPSQYEAGGWGKWNGSKWKWDCVCLGKGILWGWKADTTKPRGGGAVYGSNGVPDIGTEQMIDRCSKVSTDFSKLTPGELLWLPGHVGYYIGNGQVIEATAGWNTYKVIQSQVDAKGNRTYNGKGGSVKWQKHGRLPWITYEDTPTPSPTPTPTPTPKPAYTTGIYETLANVKVRTGAGLNYKQKLVKELTADGKKHATSKKANDPAVYKKGTQFSALEIIKKSANEYWAKTPSGYVNIIIGDTVCSKKIK